MRPLQNTEIRLDDGRQLELDSSGQCEAQLEAGTHNIEIRVDGDWVKTTLQVDDDDEMLVVDVSDDDASATPGLVGHSLGGRYDIRQILGQGGMGTVYRAWDTRLERPVAIKTLNARLRENEEAGRLFLQEARQMAPLSHPHLVAVHDVATIDELDVMVTELVEGSNLNQWIQEHGALGIDDALIIAYQMTVAIAFLHDRQIIHRDLKPANAVLEEGGGLKLIDFGLARSLEELMAKGTEVRGTPAYMAPEQATGPGPSSATDVYQLGVTIYELLTGQLPADPEGGGILAYATAEHDPISTHRQGLPQPLIDIVDACLAEDPDERPKAADVADRLADLYYERNDRRPPSNVSPGDWTPPDDRETMVAADDEDLPESDAPTPGDSGDSTQLDTAEPDASTPDVSDDSTQRSPSDDVAPGGPLTARGADYTGAGSTGGIDWDRPIGRIVIIIVAVTLFLGAGLLIHALVFAPDGDESPTPQEQIEQPTDGEPGEEAESVERDDEPPEQPEVAESNGEPADDADERASTAGRDVQSAADDVARQRADDSPPPQPPRDWSDESRPAPADDDAPEPAPAADDEGDPERAEDVADEPSPVPDIETDSGDEPSTVTDDVDDDMPSEPDDPSDADDINDDDGDDADDTTPDGDVPEEEVDADADDVTDETDVADDHDDDAERDDSDDDDDPTEDGPPRGF